MGGSGAMAYLLAAAFLLFSSSFLITPAIGDAVGEGGTRGRGMFIFGKTRKVVRTEAGQISVASGRRWRGDPKPLQIAFIGLAPSSLLIPQYVDANLILFILSGEAEVAWVEKDDMIERKMRRGDVNVIPAGSTFYLTNTNTNESSRFICSISTPNSSLFSSHQSFLVGEGARPSAVLAGFGRNTLASAFNLSSEQLRPLMKKQKGEAIVHFSGGEEGEDDQLDSDEEDEITLLSAKNILYSLIGKNAEEEEEEKTTRKSTSSSDQQESCNLYDGEPGFKNDYGWSTAVDEQDFSPLAACDVGVYLVNLTAGSMMAPHYNPTATEYGVVLRGSGSIQVVFPNGTAALTAKVSAGDVFRIPRYFPFCQVASPNGPMEFFGFTTSSKRNHPQFLAGASSVLRSMKGREMATAFGVTEEELGSLLDAQRESIILPVINDSGLDGNTAEEENAKEKRKVKMVRKLKKKKLEVEVSMKGGLFE